MSNSTFDADAFLQTEVEGEMEEKFTPVPADDYEAFISDIKARSYTNKDNEEKPILDVIFTIPDDALKADLGMEEVTVRQSIFLDVEGGALVFGPNKNVRLGKLRAAVGQNTAEAWGFYMLKNAGPVMITVTHRQDTRDPENVFSEVSKVAAV